MLLTKHKDRQTTEQTNTRENSPPPPHTSRGIYQYLLARYINGVVQKRRFSIANGL